MSRYGKDYFKGNYDEEKIQEYALRIMEALSGVDEDLLEKSSQRVIRNTVSKNGFFGNSNKRNGTGSSLWRFASTWAAVLGLMAVGAASWGGYQLMRTTGANESGVIDVCPQAIDSFEENNADRQEVAEGENVMPESMAVDEAVEDPHEREEPGMAGSASDRDSEAGHDSTEGDAMRENEEPDAEKTPCEYNKIMDVENKQENEAEAVDNSQDAANDSGGGNMAGNAEGAETDGLSEDISSCEKLNSIEYTEREARELEGIGGYIPDALPGGYEFYNAYSNQDLEEQNLTICWTRGMDAIILHLEITDRELRTVDVENRETYDERLYEIPYGETVPAEYREIFNNPVFSWEDLNLEIIKCRMSVVQDTGDTATPRGKFKVFYPGNALISFNGRGTAEEIWEMFCSIGDDNR